MHAADIFYMRKTFALARKGIGRVQPNPLVGAIIVKNDRIISTGYHKAYGAAHAELDAINRAKESVAGATLYCNLEPCCHTNKQTPPCAQRIIAENIQRVVIAHRDPNPLVNGKGIELLRAAGIEVVEGIEEQKGAELNEIFFTSITTKKPFIHLKWAQTIDGNIATVDGTSKWLSHQKALHVVHRMRKQYDAIAVGQHTLVKDNPHLTARSNKQVITCPWRIILTNLEAIQPDHHVVSDAFKHKTIIFTTPENCASHTAIVQTLHTQGVHIETIQRTKDGHLDLHHMIATLAHYRISSLMVEGGSTLLSSFIAQHLWHRMSVFIAPLLLGKGIKVADHLPIQTLQEALRFNQITYKQYGDTLLYAIKNSQKGA